MSTLKIASTLLALSILIGCAVASHKHTEKEKTAMETTLNHHIQMFDRVDIAGWKSDFGPDAVIEGLKEKYSVSELGNYFDKLGATKMKSKITAPPSISDYHAVFARVIRGSTKDGCTFNIPNVITLVRFNEKLQVIGWNDMWEEIDSFKQCAKDEL